jgi:hypothetical protein
MALRTRPTKWENNERLALLEDFSNYDLKRVHLFFINVLKGKHNIHHFYKVVGLENEVGIQGQLITPENMIILCSSLRGDELYSVLLHELWHLYFRDDCDTRKWRYEDPERNPTERRADMSSMYMINWYKLNLNKSKYADLQTCFKNVVTLTKSRKFLEKILNYK